MEEKKEKIKIDKSKIIANTITATITIIVSLTIIVALSIVIIPMMKNEASNVKASPEMAKYLERIQDALSKVSNTYIDDVEMEKLVEGAISGIANATGDRYTRYISEEEYKEMLNSGTEVYNGIGVHITYDKDESGILVLGLMPNSPAMKAEIKAGDVIVQVDEMVVTYENYYEAIDKLKGKAETEAKILIKRKGEIIEKSVKREAITPNNIESEILENNIGYVKIWSFDNDIYKQFKEQYDILISKNIKGLIIDVRNNPGGLVKDTVNILNLMLPKCDILKLVNKTGNQKIYKCDGKNEINIPLAVVTNSRSASASEILASAIKDSKKGVVVGNTTYGKGIVQSIEGLGGYGALSITTSKYYTPSGIEIHKNGIEPNIAVDLPEELKNEVVIEKSKDTQLQKAIEYIMSQNK
ncbi:MAG: S41 family peptidase [Clostridia bacterium]